jgi:transcriptional regulator with PAS, ATPase and Fis domain
VGKEVFSQIIHSQSPRKHNKFIAVNCGAIPAGTINSELFGHEKGSFTGALSDRKGYFETVNGGTILLDEIGEMPLDTQSFLLRILESGEYIRVGASKTQHTDVRIIAATNVNLLDRVSQGKFREDLYYRLNTVPIHVPSLKERKEDIHILFRKFASDFSEKYRTDPIQLDEESKRMILSYPWPGNIRELKNVVEQLSVLNENNLITVQDLVRSIPNIQKSLLPTIRKDSGDDNTGMYEREILYKLLFDMKGDLNDLKQVVFELIKSNDLSVPDISKVREIQSTPNYQPQPSSQTWESAVPREHQPQSRSGSAPIIINTPDDAQYNMEEVEENLSMAAMEKELIDKVLRKHKNRRKDAAEELGISERTLYRKIKLYELT